MARHKHIASIVSKKYENWEKGFVDNFWSKVSYSKLEYQRQPFNNDNDIKQWRSQGYTQEYFTGSMCDMNSYQPPYVDDFINWFKRYYLSLIHI